MLKRTPSGTDPSPVKMLHIFPTFGYGGQQTRFAALAAGLGEDFSHRVIVLDDDLAASALLDGVAEAAFEQFRPQKTSTLSAANIFGLRTRLKRAKADILCTYNWGSIEAVLANAIGPRLPHIHFEDGFGPGESAGRQALRRVWARRLLLRKAALVVPSRILEMVAVKRWKLPPANLWRIENGVDAERFRPPPSKRGDGIAVGAVGALRPEKNFRRLIDAFSHASSGVEAHLTLIGDGPEKEALARAAEESAAAGRIFLPGAVSAPEEAYRAFDLFALSSDTEQAPMAVMEAMAAGLPIVATDVGDIAAMASKENRPFITPLGDEDAYRAALGRLMRDHDARARLGAANRKKACEAFSLARMIERHRALYLAKAARCG
jgi:glycosyltransferase involved in cell wall biosynthesis